jgi:FdhD protein
MVAPASTTDRRDDDADPGDEATRVARVEWAGGRACADDDEVVREEPLEIRVAGAPLAVVMRTPGHDEELVRGFLLSERVVASPQEIRAIVPCSAASGEAEGNVVQATLAEGVEVDWARLRRHMYASSSCGVCGKRTIAAALAVAPALVDDGTRVGAETLYALPGRLRDAQAIFGRTGGLHAAGLFDAAGTRLVVREDVGRHNAVDKVIGWAAARGESLARRLLVVSGRVSFEIVQKALAARAPVVAAVSAPSSLAIEAARAANVTLVAFLRDRRMGVYAGDARVIGEVDA